MKAGRSIEIRIGKEGISYTSLSFLIISETIIDDQCLYE